MKTENGKRKTKNFFHGKSSSAIVGGAVSERSFSC